MPSWHILVLRFALEITLTPYEEVSILRYTLPQKKHNFSYSISTGDPGSGSITQGHEHYQNGFVTRSIPKTKHYHMTTDLQSSPKKCNFRKLHFFWGRVYKVILKHFQKMFEMDGYLFSPSQTIYSSSWMSFIWHVCFLGPLQWFPVQILSYFMRSFLWYKIAHFVSWIGK